VPLVAPLRPLLNITDLGLITQAYRALGGAPKPLVRRAFQLTSGTKVLTRPLATLQHLDDAEWLAQIEAVDHFTRNMIAYPGRTFGQLYHRMVKANQLRDGVVHHDGLDIRVDAITVPVLVFAGNTDGIAPINAVRRLVDLLPNAAEVRFEIVPGGHLGMLTGRAARATTWVVLDEWLDQHATPELRAAAKRAPTGRAATKKGAAKKAAPKKAAAKKGTAKKAAARSRTAKKAAADPPAIGSNPERRYGSASSRNLGRRS
jgi:polyhydroxyalkanoate synthase subunit PhaC